MILSIISIILLIIIIILLLIYIRKEIKKNFDFIEHIINNLTIKDIYTRKIIFSQPVIDYYKHFKENFHLYTLNEHTISRSTDNIEIWIANNLNNRRFYSGSSKTIWNKNLTHYDQLLLEKIHQILKEDDKSFNKILIL